VNTGIKFKFVSSFSLVATALSIFSYPAQAVTNGSLVPNPKDDAPYVVSIWNSESSDDYKDAEFICTGTLIAPQIVLTAAHCTTYTTSYFVKVGAGALNDSTGFTAVTAVWTSPRYNPKTFINDIGLLKLEERFENISFPTLANSLTAKKINKFTSLRIFGWGLDQNKNFADLLRTSNLSVQDTSAAKTFGKYFNPTTMISAGRKIPAENVWSGACNGDSGGPLLSTIDGINVIVGVTSWGAKNCLPNKPSIFARISYYQSEVKKGIKDIEAQSVVVNRTAPIATDEPALTPVNPIPGNSLKCYSGKWKNAVSIRTTWISPARLLGSTNSEVSVLASDGGSIFKCEIIVSVANASVRRVLTASIIGNAALSSSPAIAGVLNGATFKSGQTARCEGWNWKTPVDSEKVAWFTSSTSQPSVPVNGRQLGSGSSLTFDSNILKGENGRYLICQVTGVKNGFESHFTASKYITTPSAPVISSVSLSASSLTSSGTATCSFTSYSENESTRVDWGYTSVSGYFTQYSGLSGERVQLTRDLVQQAAGKYLACRVTLSNSGGEASKSANTYNTFASLPNAPIVSAYLSGSVIAGSTARCSASSSYDYGSNLTYAWGKTSSNGSRLIEGEVYSRSTSYTLTSSLLDNLAGAYLTCVVTLENDAGSVSSASSISIPNNKIIIPQPTAPIVETQIASSTSISVKIRVPSISGFDGSKMVAKLNVVSAPNCTNLSVNPGSTYDCAGLSANATYTANVSVSSSTGQLVTNTSSNVSFTTIGLGSLQTPAAPTFTPISPTEVRVALPGITGFNANTMSAQLYIYYQTSLSARGIDGSASTIVVKELASGKTLTGYIVLRSLTDGSEVRSAVITFTLPTDSSALNPTFSTVTSINNGFTFQITNYNSAYTWSTYVEASSQPGAGAIISSSGLVTVSGMTSGASATIIVRTSRTGYEPGTNLIAGTALSSTSNQLKIIAVGPDSDGITNIGVCFTDPSVLSGNVTYNISGASSGSFLKHSGTPACPSFASGSTGLRLSPDTSYNYSATASNNGINYSATLSFRTPAATTLPGLTPSFGARVADTYSGGFKYQITNYDSSYTWAVTTTSGSASISSSGLLSVISVPTKQSATLTVTTRKTGYNPGSASITSVSPWDLSAEIQTQNITATLSGTTLTVNVPDAKGWTWTLIWDGYVQRTGITSFPYVVNGFSTNKNIQLAASDNLQNYGYSRVFLPIVSAPTVVTPEVIFNSGNFTSGVLGGSIAPGGSFGISWRVINTDQISSTVALIDSNGNSASWVGGALVSGTVRDGTYQASLSVPGGFTTGRYLICAQAISSTNERSASQCGSRSEYVKVAELQVNTAPVISPSKYSGTDAYSGIVPPGTGQFWESGFQNAASVSVVASSPGEASIVAPFSSSWGGTVVIAVADGMSVGQKLFKAAIFVPVGTPKNKLFTLTWTATSATGQTLVVTEGSFNTGP
jgi:secreted trypsin-like serine protease